MEQITSVASSAVGSMEVASSIGSRLTPKQIRRGSSQVSKSLTAVSKEDVSLECRVGLLFLIGGSGALFAIIILTIVANRSELNRRLGI